MLVCDRPPNFPNGATSTPQGVAAINPVQTQSCQHISYDFLPGIGCRESREVSEISVIYSVHQTDVLASHFYGPERMVRPIIHTRAILWVGA